jgi:hypothetical protein
MYTCILDNCQVFNCWINTKTRTFSYMLMCSVHRRRKHIDKKIRRRNRENTKSRKYDDENMKIRWGKREIISHYHHRVFACLSSYFGVFVIVVSWFRVLGSFLPRGKWRWHERNSVTLTSLFVVLTPLLLDVLEVEKDLISHGFVILTC